MAAITTRAFRGADLDEVLELDRLAFRDAHAVAPLDLRRMKIIVAEMSDIIAGFVSYLPTRDAIHLVSVATHPDSLMQGVGTRLVGALKRKLSPKRPDMTTMVSETDLVAQLFFKKLGFRCTSIVNVQSEDDALIAVGYFFAYSNNEVATCQPQAN